MRSKNILSIVAFVAAFGLSVAFAGLFITKNSYTYNSTNCFKYQQNAAAARTIETLITQDYANGYVRDRKIYEIGEGFAPKVESVTFADHAEVIESYVDDSSSIEAGNLPADFKAAWREHLKVWRDYSNFLDESANISNQTACSLRKFKGIDDMHTEEIDRTWYEVLRIGRSYGANVR